MKQLKIITLLIIAIVASTGVYAGLYYNNENSKTTITKGSGDKNPKINLESLPDGNFSQLSEALNRFALEFYKQIIKSGDDNIFFSPYSIFIALAMTYEGASNKTAEEMMEVLNIPQNNETLLNSIKKLYYILNQNEAFDISTANALWIRNNLDLLLNYSKIIEEYYLGHSSKIDVSNPAEVARIINEWVEEETNGKIKDLIQEGDITLYTALILTNAIYFKGDWEAQFDPENTKNRDFELSSGETISVPTMFMEGSETLFNYTETEELQILELPYVGGELSMLVLLPKERNVEEIIESMSYEQLSEWRANLSETGVNIYLPKFKLETEYDLEEPLRQMGMPSAFDRADFTGMCYWTSTGLIDPLSIDKVIHKAFVEVNEEGTEAAAATAVIMYDNCISISNTFNADHPFIFLIQHKETGSILFMGNVGNPTA